MESQGLRLDRSQLRLPCLKEDFGSRCPEVLVETVGEAETVVQGEAVVGARPVGPVSSIVLVVPARVGEVVMVALREEEVTEGWVVLRRLLRSE